MVQSRRPSATTRHTPKHQSDPSSSTNDSLKPISSNTPLTSTPFKRRNENKPHPKTSPTKRDPDPTGTTPQSFTTSGPVARMTIAGVGASGDHRVVEGTSLPPQMKDLGHRRVVSGIIVNGQRANVVISFPAGGMPRSQAQGKVVSTDFDDLQSTSKGDLQFSLDVPDSSEAGNTMDGSLEHVDGESNIPGDDMITHEMSVAESPLGPETTDPQVSDIVAIPPPSQDPLVFHPPDTLAPPTPPAAPPVVPYTPKRQVKLATSNSSAAAWFATGPISSAKKKDPDPKDMPPTVETPPSETLPAKSPLNEEPFHAQPAQAEPRDFGLDTMPVIFNIDETSRTVVHPFVITESDPGNESIMKSDMNMMEMLSIPLGPSTEMPGGITASSDSPVVGLDTSAFVQCIFRPYTRRPKTVDPTPSTLSAPEKQTPALMATDDVTETSSVCVDTTVTMVESNDRPVTPVDDKSDDGIVVIRGMTSFEETEGVKRRWFREEMRQSPEREGEWTVEEGQSRETIPLPRAMETAPMETSLLSSYSTDFVMVESPPTEEPSTDNDAGTSSVVITPSIDTPVVPEPVKISSIFSTTFNSATKTWEKHDTNLVTPIKQKYKVIGGKVVAISDTPKVGQVTPTSSDVSSHETSIVELPVASTLATEAKEKPAFPPRKHARKQSSIPRRESIAESDGWSTEAEEGVMESPSAAHVTEEIQIPGIITDVPVLEAIAFTEPETPETEIEKLVLPAPVAEEADLGEAKTDTNTAPTIEVDVHLPPPAFTWTDEPEATSPVGESTDEPVAATTISVETVSATVSAEPESSATIIEEQETKKQEHKVDSKSFPYEIVEGKVLRKSSAGVKIRTDTPSPSDVIPPVISPIPPTISFPAPEQRSPHSTSRRPHLESFEEFKGRIVTHVASDPRYGLPPQNSKNVSTLSAAAEVFVSCGPMADNSTTGLLTRKEAPWPGAPHHAPERGVRPRPNTIGRDGKRPQEDAQFAYGKTEPINQPSRREEPFDPYADESQKALKSFKDRYLPILQSHNEQQLKDLFNLRPSCFCGYPCAQFDGVVPVWVCGMFRRG